MGWKEKLQPASFRGIPFDVETGDLTTGRRNQTHQYPGRDVPYTEDLGRAARKVSIEAFLVGDDYMERRDQLLKALEQGGSGELVHPWHGRMMLDVDGESGVRVRHGVKDGRFCAITISFVESGSVSFPAATDAPGAQALLAADAAKAASINEFSGLFVVGGMPSFVLDDALQSFSGTMRALESAVTNLGIISTVAHEVMQGDLSTLLPNSYSLANRFYGLFLAGDALVSGADAHAINFPNTSTAVDSTEQFPPPVQTSGTTAASQQVATNNDAIATLANGALLVQAAGMTAAMSLPVFDDAALLRTKLLRALDAHSMRLRTDDAYAAFSDLRSKVNQDITSKMRNAARLRDYTPLDVLPALVLAYDLYEQPTRDFEIVARNKIRHPGFVPVQPLKVLTA
ncbi:MAG: DNA circularization N-terminal domain-containing protein [Sulfuritalea sp.]|jgi:prophage DNA circulation protein|nr:DNA circularization N-terminal domain-containing protein [Sulfuritalea sp.]